MMGMKIFLGIAALLVSIFSLPLILEGRLMTGLLVLVLSAQLVWLALAFRAGPAGSPDVDLRAVP